MGRKMVDLSGRSFGRLTVLRPAGKRGRNSVSLCLCQCGKEKEVMNFNLLSGSTESCGCLHREKASARVKANPPRKKHGMSHTITYNSWQTMVSRCLKPHNSGYCLYGARGITVCDRWADPDKGFTNFVEDMGHRPSGLHSIDRVDNEKGYEPGNCRWATNSQQAFNRPIGSSNKTGFKGICESGVPHKPWKAEIRADGVKFHLGCYETKEEAALAYNLASEELQGEFGWKNPLPPIPKEKTEVIFARIKKILEK